MLSGPNPETAAGFIIPLLGLRLSLTSDIPPVLATPSQLSEREDHVRVVVIAEVFSPGCTVQVCEMVVGMRGFKVVAGLGTLFSSVLHSLGGLFNLGFPDTDLVLAVMVADDIHADPPVVVLKGGQEDGVVHVVMLGKGSSKPDGHLFQGYVSVSIVGGGEEVGAIDGESLSLSPFDMGVPGSLYELNVFWFDLCSVIVGDVESCGLSRIVLKVRGADGDSGVVTAAAVAVTASSSSRGLVFFIVLEFFELVFCLVGPVFAVVGLVGSIAEAVLEEAYGGGEVFGIVEEGLAITWSGDLQDHGCGMGG
jgi:hypothetical protein